MRDDRTRPSWRPIRIITEDAEARGVAWLKSCRSPEQLADYDRTRSFAVIGERSRNRYRICWGTSQNIIRHRAALGRSLLCQHLATPLKDAVEGDEGG
jgi:hypothetical protein